MVSVGVVGRIAFVQGDSLRLVGVYLNREGFRRREHLEKEGELPAESRRARFAQNFPGMRRDQAVEGHARALDHDL